MPLPLPRSPSTLLFAYTPITTNTRNPATLPSGDKLLNGELWLDHSRFEYVDDVRVGVRPRE